jgi:hypothetical protein
MFTTGAGTATAAGILKKIARSAAVVILAAQLLALAHYHRTGSTPRVDSQTGIVADSSLCALCIVAFHLPLNPAASPAIEQQQVHRRSGSVPPPRVVYSSVYPAFSIRAPPRA